MYIQTSIKTKETTGGFIALMATIVISAVLLVMSVEGSLAGWSARFNVLGTEAKEQAQALAQGCADQALSAIVTDPSYTGDATTTTSVGTCHVFPIEFNSPITGVVTIKTQAVVRDSYANLEMQMDMSEIHIDAIPEAPTRGTLVVITNVVNDGSGTKLASDFAMNVVGGSPSLNSFAGNETGVVVTVAPGAYGVTGSSASGYSVSASTNCAGTVAPGALKFCTVTYNDITTTLTLLVNVVNDDGGTLAYDDFPIYIDGHPANPGQRYDVSVGNHTATADSASGYVASVWGYQCSSGGSVNIPEGQNKTCIINFNDTEPPTPDCADTVMMLDRSYSMFGNSAWIPDEKTAAKSLVDLYSAVTPNPKMGVGRFGDVATGRSAEIFSQLSTGYTAIKTAIDNGLPQNPISYTNLSAAITKASDELNSIRHTVGKEKVLIIVSDGDPNEPTGTQSFDTGFMSPSSSAHESGSSLWSTSTNSYGDGGGDSSGAVNGSANRERYYTFGFGGGAGLPSGSTINGIQAKIDAWASAGFTNTPGSVSESPANAVAPNQWTNPTRVSASDNSYATNAVNGNQQGLGGFGFSIPVNATITGIQVTTEAKVSVNPTTFLSDSFGTGNPTDIPNWNENGNDTVVLAPGSGNDTTSPSGGSFARIDDNGGWICRTVNATGLTDLAISYNWRGDSDAENYNPSGSDGGPDVGTVDYNTSGSADCNGTSGWNTVASHDLSNDTSWSTYSTNLPSVLNNDNSWTIRFRNPSINGSGNPEYFRVDGVVLTSNPSSTGSIGIALSSNNGSVWTSTKTTALDGTESVDTPSGNNATDLWGRGWVPADFSDGNFALRVTNNSTTGTTVSLDHIQVTVNYTVPVTSGTACHIGMDLSWNGGTSWSNEKTQSLSSAETTYTLGASNDDWSSSHTWSPSEFSNANFRARVRAIDPGSGCDNSALDHLDWLQMNVRYTQNVDPTEAALNAADTAKLAGVKIFTIHFGDDPSGYTGRELLANLASGNTSVTTNPHNTHGHQNGSAFDLSAIPTGGNTGFVSPTSQASDAGGDNNGFELNPANALTDGNGNASNMNGASDRHRFSGYNLVVPPNVTVTGIETRLDWWLESTSGNNSMSVELSWNGGTSWTSAKSLTNESTNSGNTGTLGSTGDTWGHTWTAEELLPANFRVRVTANCSGNANPSCSNRDFYLDWIPVRVTYAGAIPENGLDDNFFISPSSSDMDNIFDFIGAQVCPAIGFAAASTPPTTGQVTVITQVVNNNSGSLTADGVSFDVSPSSASPNSFTGSASGESITLAPGSYAIESTAIPEGYVEVLGAGCSSDEAGDIVAGEVRVCVITYDDVPPPPPAPNLTIHLGSWKELPVAE